MRILLEGPDGVGKTTLANILKEMFQSEYIHFEYESDDLKYKAQVENTFQYLQQKDNIIIDRFIPSEMIYGEIFRGNSRFWEDQDWLDLMFLSFDYIVFCLPYGKQDYMSQFKKMQSEREEYVKDISSIDKIYNAYQDLYIKFKAEELKSPENMPKIMRYDFFNTIKK